MIEVGYARQQACWRGAEVSKLLLLNDDESRFLEQAIEAWSTVYAGDAEFEARRVDRFNVKRKLEGKYTEAEREEIGTVALGMMM